MPAPNEWRMVRRMPKSLTRTDLLKAAQELARLGGQARAKVLPPERRSEIARRAVRVRWARERAPKRRGRSAL